MALLFLFSVTKKEGESSLPCPDIYLVTSRKVGVIQVLSLVSVRVLQRSRIDYTTELQRDLLQVFTHSIMEAERTHNLPSASWRPRKASGVVGRPES